MKLPEKLHQKLEARRAENSFRTLRDSSNAIDLVSNDYLSLARSPALAERIRTLMGEHSQELIGGGGSRLLSGERPLCGEIESQLAAFHEAQSALLFHSGFDANVGLLSSVADRHDTILFDALCHASIRDGIRLSRAQAFSFQHNDLNDLSAKLERASGDSTFIVTESVFSMDGDLAPLEEIAALAKRTEAHLIVDEAHATGIFGPHGVGRVQELDLTEQVWARVHTFGKALGVQGAAVVGALPLRNYLINFARPFIYTTAHSLPQLLSIKAAYELLPALEFERSRLWRLIERFRSEVQHRHLSASDAPSPIQFILVPGADLARSISTSLLEQGFDCRAILSPTVPKGTERLRVCLHAHNTLEQVNRFLDTVETLFQGAQGTCAVSL